jgi:hypothetical protein
METYYIQYIYENQNSMKNQFSTHILCTKIMLGPTELLPVESQSKDRQDRLLVQWTNLYKIYPEAGNVLLSTMHLATISLLDTEEIKTPSIHSTETGCN